MFTRKGWLLISAAAVVISAAVVLSLSLGRGGAADAEKEQEKAAAEPVFRYGIDIAPYRIAEDEVGRGQTLSHILGRYGIGPAQIDRIERAARPVFNMKDMRSGHKYSVFLTDDSLSRPDYFVYEKNATDYIVVSLSDSVKVEAGRKEVRRERRTATAEITSSLWNCIAANDLPIALSVEMEDIYGWCVDFFGIRKGDKFTVIYDESYIDSTRIGVGRVWGAVFSHNGKDYYAIPFEQNGKIEYWDENGKSLRKQLLKAPLKFTRISSKFSNSRLHPILKIRRPHYGVDYAAPQGTPVVAIADGVVTVKGWDRGGGGNMLKIKHANNLTSGYLHLKSYAKGITVGKRVSQGQLIGYVGMTGTATGPHLDFRLWKGSTPIDPLKAPSNSVEPITQKNLPQFNSVRDRVLAELKGEAPDSLLINAVDIAAR